jgi:hypothetical protein
VKPVTATPPRWPKPRPAFAIDDAVEDSIKAGRLRKDFDGDPYLTARCYVGRAGGIATREEHWQQDGQNDHRDDLRKLEAEVVKIERRVQKVAEKTDLVLSRPVVRGNETVDPQAHRERLELPYRALVALWTLEDVLREEREKIRQRSDKVFLAAFIEEMLYGWVRLTCRIPGRSNEEFINFVAKAHQTLSHASPADLRLPFYVELWDANAERARSKIIKDKWSWQVRKTLDDVARRSVSDRADRYEKGHLAQTVGIQPSTVYRRHTGTWAEFDEETKRLIELMLAGDRDAELILWCESKLGGKGLQNRFLDAGYYSAARRARIGSRPV